VISPAAGWWGTRLAAVPAPGQPAPAHHADAGFLVLALVRLGEVWRSGVVGSVAAVAGAVTDAGTSRWRSACPQWPACPRCSAADV